MSVQRLKPEVTAKLRSGVAINTVAQCVEELVLNSLDAGSSCVAVRLDLSFFKVQVIDNGQGISQQDLTLVGERYATSKCRTLEDVNRCRTFGYRGEALASIGEISQELIVASRTSEQQVTYSKSIGSSSNSIQNVQRASIQRPSNGTTVTVLNLLYNMPVRQSTVHSVLDVEKVRRDLEVLALGHSTVSFSLYDDVSKSWCLRLPKLMSTVKTFGHLFGSAWIQLLKLIVGTREPFKVRGYVAVEGYHNKNLQFIFVNGRRIVDDKLQKAISSTFDSLQCNVSTRGGRTNLLSGSLGYTGDCHPVYLLHIECPRDQYDIGFLPSKVLIEFHQLVVLKLLIADLIKRFLEDHLPEVIGKQLSWPSSVGDGDDDNVKPGCSGVISVHNYGKSLHSLPAKRPYKPVEKAAEELQLSRDVEAGPSMAYCESKSPHEETVPTLFLPTKAKLKQHSFPIRLSMAIETVPMRFGSSTRMSKEEQMRRTSKAINELKQRYSFNTKRKNVRSSITTQRKKRTSGKIPENIPVPVEINALADAPIEVDLTSLDPVLNESVYNLRLEADQKMPDIQHGSPAMHSPSCDVQHLITDGDKLSSKDVAELDTTTTKQILQGTGEGDCVLNLDASNGNLCIGQPEEDSNYAAVMTGDLLPVNDETNLATLCLPSRPWKTKGDRSMEDPRTEQGPNSVSKLYQNWENPILASAGSSDFAVLAIKQWSSGISEPFACTASSVNCHAYAFSRNILQNVQLIGQADCKYIVCMVPYADIPELDHCSSEPNLIILFDQHAVHERIRLEQTLKDAGFNDDNNGSEQPPKSLSVDPPLTVSLPQDVAHLALQHRIELARFIGINISPRKRDDDDDDDDENRNEDEHRTGRITVNALPSCLLEREASECKQKRPSVLLGLAQALILEVVDDLMINRTFRSRMPKVVLNVLKSQACHGAIKFGDHLDVAKCNDLMIQLRKCLLPFQCAHGRPSVTVLTDLRRIPRSKPVTKPNLHKFMQMMAENRSEETAERGGTQVENQVVNICTPSPIVLK